MAGEVVEGETMGAKLKRLQEAAIDPHGTGLSALRDLYDLAHDPAFAEYVLGLEGTIDGWIAGEETSRKEYNEKRDLVIELRDQLATANARAEAAESLLAEISQMSPQWSETIRGFLKNTN